MQFCLKTYLKELEELVNTDSASYYPQGTEKVAAFFARRYEALGWSVKYHRLNEKIGPCLAICNQESEAYDLLCLAHMDTALPQGTPAKRPFTIEGPHAKGPGVSDMKACVLSLYYVMAALQSDGALDKSSVCLLLNSDEEISSIYSRPLIEDFAKKANACLVWESARKDGSLVNERRGVGRYTLAASGIAAHSGVNPQDGSSAIHELAHWIVELDKLNDLAHGTSINVGVVHGGAGANTIAAEAVGLLDLRFSDPSVPPALESKMKDMEQHPFVAGGAHVKVSGGVTRPPMNPTPKTLAMCDRISRIGEEIGVPVRWTATGGGADGSFTAMYGVPTFDGIGPVGGNAHSEREFLVIDSVEPRYRLAKEIVTYLLNKK